ncbi:MAG: glycosyltransferase family 39 protein, partial [Thermoleophilia bacterium]|nr:glycosyltransferase family 39 protein [Thermoleophilia bacterium]
MMSFQGSEAADESAFDESAKRFWTPGRILALLIGAAVLLRVAATLTRQMVMADEVAYVRIAENLAAGNGFVDVTGGGTIYAPLLPMLMAGLGFLLRDFILSGYIVVIIFGGLLLIPVYLLGRDLIGERVGLMAAALMAVQPFFISTSEFIYSEVLYIFFLLMSLFFGWHVLKEQRLKCGAAAGICLGLAYLAQPSTLYYLIGLLGLMAAAAVRTRGLARMAGAAGALLFAFLLFAAPYVTFLHAELGQWTFTDKSMGGGLHSATHNIRREDVAASERLLMSLTAEEKEPVVLALERDKTTPFGFLLGNPGAAARNFLRQSFYFHESILSRVFPLWLLPLLGLGLFTREWTRQRAAAVGYLALMISPMLLVLAIYAHARFFMPYVSLAMIMVAAGWMRLEDWGRQTARCSFRGAWRERLAGWAPWLVGVAVLMPLLFYSGLMLKQRSYETQYKEAGLWLKEHGGEGSRIMDRTYSAAYYAGGMFVLLPYADYEDMTAYARKRDVDYLIV